MRVWIVSEVYGGGDEHEEVMAVAATQEKASQMLAELDGGDPDGHYIASPWEVQE